jgi:starch synthase
VPSTRTTGTSLALMFARSYAGLRERFAGADTLLSVHNAGYQGHYPPSMLNEFGIPPEVYNFRHLEWYDRINFLKGGLTFADMVVTVPHPCQELHPRRRLWLARSVPVAIGSPGGEHR